MTLTDPQWAAIKSSASDEWETPARLFAQLNDEFAFTLDVCALPHNAKCAAFYSPDDDGLSRRWLGVCWMNHSLPREGFERAHLLIEILSHCQHVNRNGISSEGAPPIGDCKEQRQLCFSTLDLQVRHECGQDDDGIRGRDVPSPRDALVELARLFGGDSPDAECVSEHLYGRLVNHLHLEVKDVIRRAFLPARSLRDALLDVYASFAVKQPGDIGESGDVVCCMFHDVIVPQLRGFIEQEDPRNSVAWCNPPYGRQIGKWVEKAYQEAQDGATVVCLLPARTDTRWFHDYCTHGEIRFIKGRLKFGTATENAPFPNMIVVFRSAAAV